MPEEKQLAFEELVNYVASIGEKPVREIYAGRAAEILELSPDGIIKAVEVRSKRLEKKAKQNFDDAQIRKKQGFGDKINPERLKFGDIATIEERILGILLIHSELGNKFLHILSEDDFITDFSKRIFLFIKPFLEEGKEIILSANGEFTPDELGAITSMMAARQVLTKNDTEVLNIDINLLKERKKKLELEKKIEDDPEAVGAYLNYLKETKHKSERLE